MKYLLSTIFKMAAWWRFALSECFLVISVLLQFADETKFYMWKFNACECDNTSRWQTFIPSCFSYTVESQ